MTALWNVGFVGLGLFGLFSAGVMVRDYVRNHIRGPWFEPLAMTVVAALSIFVGIVGRFQ